MNTANHPGTVTGRLTISSPETHYFPGHLRNLRGELPRLQQTLRDSAAATQLLRLDFSKLEQRVLTHPDQN